MTIALDGSACIARHVGAPTSATALAATPPRPPLELS